MDELIGKAVEGLTEEMKLENQFVAMGFTPEGARLFIRVYKDMLALSGSRFNPDECLSSARAIMRRQP